MRTIRLTEEQFQKYLDFRKKELTEINLNGYQFLAAKNGDVKAASQAAIKDAQASGINTNNDGTSVQFSADALRNKSGINEKIYTKGQISELRAKNMFKKGCATYSKSQFKPKNER